MDIKTLLKEKMEKVDLALERYMNHSPNAQKQIYEAMSYSLFAGGKRLRPAILLLAAEMCGGKEEAAMPFACALEMIHTYSLIHDDLPAMDNDTMRRGKPTNHVVYGEGMAILAGDALLNKAIEVAASSDVEPKRVIEAIRTIFEYSGTEGMIGGQVIDIENKERSEEELHNLHLLKTGGLIRAAGVCGAIAAGAGEKEIKAIDDYCINLGIAFQIRDDILDVLGTEEELGKPVGSDRDNAKTTYITLFGQNKAEALVEEYTKKAIDSLSCFGERAETLEALAEYLVGRRV